MSDLGSLTAEENELVQRARASEFQTPIVLSPSEWTRLYQGLQIHNRMCRENSPYPDRRQFYFCGIDWLMELPGDEG